MKNLFILWTLVLGSFCQRVYLVYAQAPTTAKIAFSSNRNGHSDIYVMNPNGRAPVRLTDHPGGELRPVWSPTGEHILFRSDRDGEWDLYIMKADGTNVQKVFEDIASRSSPSWDPNGKRIAYSQNETVYIATRDGKNVEVMTKGIYPHWSPNGKWIAFILEPPGEGGKFGIGVFDIRTRTRKMVLENPRRPFIKAVRWSSDNSKLAFSWFNPEMFHLQTIYTMNRDGSELQRITKPARSFWADRPAWSPHGDELLYQQSGNGKSHIFKTRLRSRNAKQLTKEGRNYLGDWFDPTTLPVHPQANRLTTLWGKLKEK